VHKAKGLEFPVVILADMTARLTPFDASRHIDTARDLCAIRIGGWSPKDLNNHRDDELLLEEQEGIRVAYVAATRARDLLVVPAVGDEPYAGGWVAPLNGAIYPPEHSRRAQQPARGCPGFASRDSVLVRPDGDPASNLTVCPGQHVMGLETAPYSVVWWSPGPDALHLDAESASGLRRDDLIVKDVAPGILRQYRDDYEAWRMDRESAVAAARRPSVEVMTATEASAAAVPSLDGISVSIESAGAAAEGPGGPRFGTLVHALLADVPLDADGEALLPALSRAHARVLGASPEEADAARARVRQVLQHPVLREAAAAAREGRCHRETPVTWRAATGAIVEGYVDLAYVAGGEFVVVDFKTDRELDGALDRYERQVQIYAAAIAAATGRPARAVLMRV
jgi:ATP-dependent exoDNAse (exonuclease V) beta subunit